MKLDTNNLRQQLRDAANRLGLPRFWRWWTAELAPLMPEAMRVAFQRRFVRPVIELAEGEAVFWQPRFGNGATQLVVAERVSLNGDAADVLAAGRAAVLRLAASASGGLAAPKVTIALGPRDILRKELVLPAAVEENLAQTLTYDLDRHTPFRADQLYFDAVVTRRDSARKMLRVDWCAALKTTLDAARRRVEAWGAVPVAVAPGPPTAPTRLNLIPSTARPRPLQWRRWQVWAPLVAVALFVFAAVFVPLVQKREYAVALNIVGAETGQQAQAAAKVRSQLEGMEGDYDYILAKKYAYPSTVQIVDEVTRALPDDTWLTQLELKSAARGKDVQREIYLRGESANAGKLIALLEDSKLVEQAAPRSPTTKIQGGTGEIFDLGAKVRTLAPPAPEPMSVAAVVPPVAPVAAPAAPQPVASAPSLPSEATPAPESSDAPPPAPRRAMPAPQPTGPLPNNGFGPFPPGAAQRMPAPVPQQPQQVPQPAPQAAQQRAMPAPAAAAVAPPAAPVAAPGAAVASPGTPAAPRDLPPPMGVPTEPSTDVPPAPTMPGATQEPPPEPQPGGNN